jgi:hypothetical protein
MIGCFDQRILASLCYAGMTVRLPHHDIGGCDGDGLFWPVMGFKAGNWPAMNRYLVIKCKFRTAIFGSHRSHARSGIVQRPSCLVASCYVGIYFP